MIQAALPSNDAVDSPPAANRVTIMTWAVMVSDLARGAGCRKLTEQIFLRIGHRSAKAFGDIAAEFQQATPAAVSCS